MRHQKVTIKIKITPLLKCRFLRFKWENERKNTDISMRVEKGFIKWH